jgi:WD40-like Beta Propeller Repeat
MTHETNHPHESGRSIPGSSSKVIVVTAVALVAVLGHASIEGHGPGAQGVWAWRAAQPVPGNVNTPALEGCPIESPDGHYLFMASTRAGSLKIDIWAA